MFCTKRKITVQRTKSVCAAEVFFCHIFLEMHGKAIWKPGISEIAKASSGIAPKSQKKDDREVGRRCVSAPHRNPYLHTCWVMAFGHKNSFIENGGQQKCLDKALLFNFIFKLWWLLILWRINRTFL